MCTANTHFEIFQDDLCDPLEHPGAAALHQPLQHSSLLLCRGSSSQLIQLIVDVLHLEIFFTWFMLLLAGCQPEQVLQHKL